MTDFTVIIQPEAEMDLDDAYNYLQSRKKGLGFDLLEEVSDIIARLESNPFLFQKVYGEKRRAITKRFGYILIYIIKGETVYILAIIHESRNPKRWMKR